MDGQARGVLFGEAGNPDFASVSGYEFAGVIGLNDHNLLVGYASPDNKSVFGLIASVVPEPRISALLLLGILAITLLRRNSSTEFS
jgi:hypothetical protein